MKVKIAEETTNKKDVKNKSLTNMTDKGYYMRDNYLDSSKHPYIVAILTIIIIIMLWFVFGNMSKDYPYHQ